MKFNKTLSIISGIMLLLAIPSMWPYGYYQIIRWVVSITGVSVAHEAYQKKLMGWAVTMIIVAILFNPIAPIYLAKGTWILIDIVVAILMFSVSKKFKNE